MNMKDYNEILPIIELYPCLQGEGSLRGIPTIAVRTTGCTHRCYFGDGGWCDSWYTSIHAEKGKYTFNDVIKMYEKNPHIRHMMLTGGSPTMHPKLLEELSCFAHNNNIFITLETEGSHYIETSYPIHLLSLSPKFSNSIPKLGQKLPKGNKEVDEHLIKTHNRFRLNEEAIRKMLEYHSDYQYKPVWDGTDTVLEEIENFRIKLGLSKNKTWIMPAGDNRKTLMDLYPKVMEACIHHGYNFSGRDHIIGYNDKRAV